MSKGLESLKEFKSQRPGVNVYAENYLNIIEKELIALRNIVSIFDIRIVGDYLIAQRGDTCVVENLKLRQSQELINLLKEVLL